MKTNRYKKGKEKSDTEDRISALPGHLIQSILEQLPIRDAARTSILSRQWRYIWAGLPDIILDESFFDETFTSKPFLVYEYTSVVSQILLFHTGPIVTFSLYISNVVGRCPEIDQVILFLSRNGIEKLTLENAYRRPYVLPFYIYSCPNLRHLSLFNCLFKKPYVSGGFSTLVFLKLERVTFGAGFLKDLFIEAPLLLHLAFVSCIGANHVKMHAPNLTTFYVFKCQGFESINFGSTPYLKEVCVAPFKVVENPELGSLINFSNLFDDLPRIWKLEFDGFILKFLATGNVPKRLRTFANHLKLLVLHNLVFSEVDQISCVLCLLKSSPNVQWLEISSREIVVIDNDDAPEPAVQYLESPDCMDQTLGKLKSVKISSLKGTRTEMVFIKLLLACSPTLELMAVTQSEGPTVEDELRGLYRASPGVFVACEYGT